MPSNEQRRKAAKRKLERQLARRAQRARRRRLISTIVAVVVVIGIVAGIYFLATSGSGSSSSPAANSSSATPTSQVDTPASIPTSLAALPVQPTPFPATTNCAYTPATEQTVTKQVKLPASTNISARGTQTVLLDTSFGTLTLNLDRALAPCTVNSFVSLAQQGYFNNTPCHRLTTEPGLQVLQCGDPTGTGGGGPGYTFNDEIFPQLNYGPGLLAMANSGPNTNGSQFFIVYGDGSGLSAKYTVFGSIGAADVQKIDTIAKAGTVEDPDNPTPGDGSPKIPVTIQKATVTN